MPTGLAHAEPRLATLGLASPTIARGKDTSLLAAGAFSTTFISGVLAALLSFPFANASLKNLFEPGFIAPL